MISEYAYGEYAWVLTTFFILWAVGYWFTAIALFPLAKHPLYKLGLLLIFVSGIGALMGGLYDVQHPLHGLAFGLGVPFIPVVAPILTHFIQRKYGVKNMNATGLSHATWISFLTMAVTMILFITQMQQVGTMDMNTPQLLTTLPDGVTAVHGYANRFLVVSYLGWLMAVNAVAMRIAKK